MKNIITGILLVLSSHVLACDNCNIYLNLSPNDYQNSVGIYLRQRMMFGEYNQIGEMIATRHTGHGNDMAFWGQMVDETYQTYELRGNYFFNQKWKATVVLPFINNQQRIGGKRRYQINGIGDPILLTAYQVFNTKRDTLKQNYSHRLTIGAGIKFPLGKTALQYENEIPNLDLQPGSGSWDGLAFLAYQVKWKLMGINTNLNVKRNGKDQHEYRYGATFNLTTNLFTDLKLKKTTLRLLGGIYVEHAEMDMTYFNAYGTRIEHYDTGGKVWFSNFGFQLFTKKIVLFGEYQYAFSNKLNGYTQLLTKNRINIGLNYNF